MSHIRTPFAPIFIAFAAFATLMFMRPIWDIDIFWHLSAGQWMWDQRSIAITDFMGIDPDRPWISFQWGYQILVYLLYEKGGYPLLRILHAALMLCSFGLLFRSYHKELENKWSAFALLAFSVLLFQDRINVRPHIFNLLGLAIVLPALLGGWRNASKLKLAGWILCFAVWANMHAGGCFLMLIVLAAIPTGETAMAIFQGKTTLWKKAWLFYAVCLLVCVLSPNFVRGILHAMTLVENTGHTIGEWNAPIAYLTELENPTLSRIVAGLTPYLCALWIAAMALRRKLSTQDLGRVAAVLALSGLSLLYVRFVHFSAPIILILIPWSFESHSHCSKNRKIAVFLVILAVLGMLWNTNIRRLYGGLTPTIAAAAKNLDERRFPIEAANFLDNAHFKGTIFCHARYGGYLRWRLGNRVRTLIDGRSNVESQTAQEIIFVHQNHNLQSTDPTIAKQISHIYDKYQLDALVLEPPAFGPDSLDCRQWTPAFRTPKLEIYYRNDTANIENLTSIGRIPSETNGCKFTL